jgi:hypothetical protein
VKDSTDFGGTKSPEADMPYLRRAYGFAAAASSYVYPYLWIASSFLLADIFFKNIGNTLAPMALVQGAAKVLRYDQIAAFSGYYVGIVELWGLEESADIECRMGRNCWCIGRSNVGSGTWGGYSCHVGMGGRGGGWEEGWGSK